MVTTALLAGGAFGLKHAAEADHVAAVATLVEDAERPAATGVAWGVGHSVPILALGVRVIAGREAVGVSILRHVHGGTGGDGAEGREGTGQDRGHRHVTVAGREIGLAHSHADEESFAVGIVHGLAGSGGVVVALAAAADTSLGSAGFLVGFSVATIAGMGVAAAGWGHAVECTGLLRVVAGVASVAVGLLLFAEIGGVLG